MRRLQLTTIFAICLAASSGGRVEAQSASPINPSSRGLGSIEMDRIRTPFYRSPDHRPVYDVQGRRVGTIETTHGPAGDDHIFRDRQWRPLYRSQVDRR